MSMNSIAMPRIPQEGWLVRLRDGQAVLVRAIRDEDRPLEQAFLAKLPPEVFSYCFIGLIKPGQQQAADELCAPDERDELGILALVSHDGHDNVIGVARYRVSEDGTRCDCAVAVAIDWRKRGVGSVLMHHLIGMARLRGVRHMYAVDAARCAGAHALASYLGFQSCPDPDDPAAVTYKLDLQG